MFETVIRELDLPKTKMLLRQYNIDATDEEIRYLLPILKQNVHILPDKTKRSALIRTLPQPMQYKLNAILARFSL